MQHPGRLTHIQSRERLMAIWGAVHRHPVREAREWHPERRPGYVRVTQAMGAYAINRATRLACRERGDAAGEAVYRIICDNILETLPPWCGI